MTTTDLALVPTMGALHGGHVALVERARQLAERVVVSIFVNPTQFGANEDFAHYPRTLDADRKLLAGRADIFAPEIDDVYPPGAPPEVIRAGALGEVWEGASRPGHFDGVLTVVSRLFELVHPSVAVFGEKDWQQLVLVRRMAAERHPHIVVVGVETVRDSDGLALSSRNRYLSTSEREAARHIPESLRAIVAAGGTDESIVRAVARLDDAGIDIDYLEVVDAESLEPTRELGLARVIVAARVGGTRLIDNMPVVVGRSR